MSFNILQGKSNPNENSWTTLIAYCGGRLEDGSACGKNPLVLGKSKRCDYCRKLICPDCGFCCKKCRGHQDTHAERPARLLLSPQSVPVSASRTARVRPRTPNPGGEFDENAQALFDALRHYRMTLAREENVPPYVIANDRTLRDIVLLRPSSLEELKLVHNFGPTKVKKYGDGLLAIVQQAT